MIPCSFVSRTEKCVTCKKQAKNGFRVGNDAEFVCSEACAKPIQDDESSCHSGVQAVSTQERVT